MPKSKNTEEGKNRKKETKLPEEKKGNSIGRGKRLNEQRKKKKRKRKGKKRKGIRRTKQKKKVVAKTGRRHETPGKDEDMRIERKEKGTGAGSQLSPKEKKSE